LLAHCLARGSAFTIDTPTQTPLEVVGERPFLRMIRGAEPSPKHKHIFAITGPEFG